MSELETPFRFGMAPSGTVVPSEAGAGNLAGDGGAAVTVTVSWAATGVPFTVLTMLAVAVRVTELTEVAPAATGMWAARLTGLAAVTELTEHVAVLAVLAQPLVIAGCWLEGAAVRATDTFAAEPFWVDTVTTNAALCPRGMLACARWTLTQSSGWAEVALEAGLALVLELAGAVARGLATMKAPSEAEALADAEEEPEGDGEDLEDDGEADTDDGEADPEADEEGEPDVDGELDSDADPDADGDPDADPAGVLLTGPADADVAAEALAEGDGDADGEGEGKVVRLGVGDGLAEGDDAASSWHLVSVLALGDLLGLGVAETAITEPARAIPGQIASPPKISRPPASKLSVIARTYAKRI